MRELNLALHLWPLLRVPVWAGTPLFVARQRGHADVVRMLEAAVELGPPHSRPPGFAQGPTMCWQGVHQSVAVTYSL